MVYTQAIQVAAVCALMLLLSSIETDGRPAYLIQTTIFQPGDCKTNITIDTLCQKCAKSTKSNIVYPMCCHDTEDVMDWCFRYINFGKQK